MKKIILGVVLGLVLLAGSFSAEAQTLNTDLKIGLSDAATGGQVSVLQSFLKSIGYLNTAVTGYFGTITQAAVKQYQYAQAINPISGYVGNLTRTSINNAVSATSSATVFTRDLTLGSQGDDVEALQKILVGAGFLSSSILNDGQGYFGNTTKTALAAFQAWAGITPADGFFGPLVRAYLPTHTIPTGCEDGRVYSSTTGERCPITQSSGTQGGLPVSVIVSDKPTLLLSYDSKKNETLLTGVATVIVKAGNEDVFVLPNSPRINFDRVLGDPVSATHGYLPNGTKQTFVATSNLTTETVKDENGNATQIYRVKAGTSASFKESITASPEKMFKGVYVSKVPTFIILSGGGYKDVTVTGTTISERVPIVGEKNLPSVTVTYPNGDETVKIGQRVLVKWTSQNITKGMKMNIDLVGSNNITSTRLVTKSTNNGAEYVIIPPSVKSGSHKISVSTDDAGPSAADVSDRYFTVVGGNSSIASIPVSLPNIWGTEVFINNGRYDSNTLQIKNPEGANGDVVFKITFQCNNTTVFVLGGKNECKGEVYQIVGLSSSDSHEIPFVAYRPNASPASIKVHIEAFDKATNQMIGTADYDIGLAAG